VLSNNLITTEDTDVNPAPQHSEGGSTPRR
jgi:hypothetical protein